MMNIFDKFYDKYDLWYERNKFVYLSELDVLKKLLPRRGKGLEIGVGTGRFASVLGVEFGLDISINMLRIAKDRKVKVCLADAQCVPFKADIFDYVLINVTLSFINRPKELLHQVKRILKKKGNLVIGFIEKNSLLGIQYQKKDSIFYKQANLFTVTQLTSLLSEFGFNNFCYRQTVFNELEDIKSKQPSSKGFEKGSFIVVSCVNS